MKQSNFNREQVTELLKKQRQICAETARIAEYHELRGEGATPYDVNVLRKLATGEYRIETTSRINIEDIENAKEPEY